MLKWVSAKSDWCKRVFVKAGWCESSFVLETGVCKTLEVKQKRVKLVDASGMAVSVHVWGTRAAG